MHSCLIGFIRINPATAPLNPPGAAPTLTTIYDEHDGVMPSEFDSPTNSLSKEAPTSTVKQKPKRKHRLGLAGKPAPGSVAVQGTKNEKKRTQEIADSLDLGLELTPNTTSGKGSDIERRRGTVIGVGEPNKIVRKGDGRLDLREEKRASIGAGLHGGKRRSSVG